VRLDDGREMTIGGMDHDWYTGWIKGESDLACAKNAHIRGRR